MTTYYLWGSSSQAGIVYCGWVNWFNRTNVPSATSRKPSLVALLNWPPPLGLMQPFSCQCIRQIDFGKAPPLCWNSTRVPLTHYLSSNATSPPAILCFPSCPTSGSLLPAKYQLARGSSPNCVPSSLVTMSPGIRFVLVVPQPSRSPVPHSIASDSLDAGPRKPSLFTCAKILSCSRARRPGIPLSSTCVLRSSGSFITTSTPPSALVGPLELRIAHCCPCPKNFSDLLVVPRYTLPRGPISRRLILFH